MTDEIAHQLEVLTWEGFGLATRSLATDMAEAGYHPDLILCIARGGLPVGGALGYALGVKNCAAISVEFYTGIGETLAVPVVLPPTPPLVDLAGLDVLVADDVADSGKTLEKVLDLVRPHVARLRSAVLYTKPRTVVIPDYSWVTTDRWIDFPWSSQPPVAQSPRGTSDFVRKPGARRSSH